MITTNVSSLTPDTAYMLRNDGLFIKCTTIHPYVDYKQVPYVVRKLLFHKMGGDSLQSLKWFYDNSSDAVKENIINLISVFANSFNANERWAVIGVRDGDIEYFNSIWGDYVDTSIGTVNKETFEQLFDSVNNQCNQEFLRVRYGGMYWGSSHKGSIYFRIGSTEFNWAPLIYELVSKYKTQVKDITVSYDAQSVGKSDIIKYHGIPIDNTPYDEFWELKGNPIFESKQSYADIVEYRLSQGYPLADCYFGELHPLKLSMIYWARLEEDVCKYGTPSPKYEKEYQEYRRQLLGDCDDNN